MWMSVVTQRDRQCFVTKSRSSLSVEKVCGGLEVPFAADRITVLLVAEPSSAGGSEPST